MKTVLIPGSFDPVTRGHADLIARAAALFDRVEVVIFENSRKKSFFPTEARLSFLEKVCAAAGGNVHAGLSHDTVAHYAKEHGIHAIVKGLRNASDLQYESDMAKLNLLAGGPETLFLPTDAALAHISSTWVREFLTHSLPVTELLPPAAAAEILAAYREKV